MAGQQGDRNMTSTVQVSIHLLGRFDIHIDGQMPGTTVQLTRRACELIQLLSLEPQRSMLHEQVVETLWPHLDPKAGSANLRKAAHHARQYLGERNAVLLRAGRVLLLPGHKIEIDALSFEKAADEALAYNEGTACLAAAQLYGGDLLPQARYESWTEAPRQRLREKYLRLLRQGGDYQRLVQEDPSNEAAHLALMRTELGAGRRSAALRWYGHLRDHLQQSVGIQPGEEVEALRRECLSGLPVSSPVFVGRSMELVRLLIMLRHAATGKPGGAVLRGPAGMGKTAFCRRLAQEARGLGWQVHLVQASDWTRPYGLATDLIEPLLQAGETRVREAIGQHAQAVLGALIPDSDAQALALPIGRHQVVGAVRRLLMASALGKPVILVVDDAHAADDSSAELLTQLAASGPPLFVLFACRPQLPTVLGAHVTRMLRAGTLEAIELPPLSPDESALLAARAEPGLRQDAVASVARMAAGVPFAVVELARGADGQRVPRDVCAAIAARLCDVDEAALKAMRRLALSTEVHEADAALALASDDETDSAALLDQALTAGVLIIDDGRYRFRHALVRQALIDALPPHQRLALHREVASRLEQIGVAPGLVGLHWLAAGQVDKAVPFSVAAARTAFELGAYMDVLRHVDPLLEHRPLLQPALVLRAESMDALGRPGTLAAYDAAAQVSLPELAHELRAKRALAQVKMSDPAGALEYLKNVEATTVPGRLAQALAYSGAAALGFGTPAEGTRRSAEVRRIALETGDQGTLVIASWSQAAAAHARGDLHNSVWADLRDTSQLPHLAVRVFDGHLCITQRFLYGSRPYADVIAFANALGEEASRLGADRGRAFAVTLGGEAKLLNGQLDSAEQDLIAGGRLHRAIGGATGEALALQRRSELAIYRGRLDLARALLDDALDVARQSDVGFHLLDRIYGTRIALARDDDSALGVLEEAQSAVRGPLETCPGCRITFAIPATIASAQAHETELAATHLRSSEYLANVVMRLPAWNAALNEARGHVALASGDTSTAQRAFTTASQGFLAAGQPLDGQRCKVSASRPS
jgi:DNA-binding SARP family transcriptional activator